MGSGNSKPAERVFDGSETPTNSTREKSLEIQVQSRVESELQRLHSRESQILVDLESRLSESDKDGDTKGLSREQVQAEIDALKERLERMPRMIKIDGEVERARGEVVKCLRLNDRTPLDCYKEVEEFKNQTRRMEKEFVVRTVGRDYP
ncbi:unnamed protein product [Tuber melanosporum]|uniref:(Perigord truffle) hypothetical protein n=1 Tax=Tuber melanosporum (strain Mel28) TaxID=656061 RepID=D5GNK5_TUBMM|nr:uncharacterized protein GSTUM_00011327001 [Tuber melanosporum]CAZ86098.1 unnamed protein product [Tuber melanosporum]